MGGAETPATTLTATAYFFAANPDVLARLQQYIRSVFTSEDEIVITALHKTKLPYLDAVINESLRAYPAGASGLLRLVPGGGDAVSGRHVPAGVGALLLYPNQARGPNAEVDIGIHTA